MVTLRSGKNVEAPPQEGGRAHRAAPKGKRKGKRKQEGGAAEEHEEAQQQEQPAAAGQPTTAEPRRKHARMEAPSGGQRAVLDRSC